MHLTTKLLAISLFLLMLASCTVKVIDPNVTPGSTSSGGSKPDCETQNYGWVDATNTSKNPYDLWINGAYVMQLKANSLTKDIRISRGPATIYVKQVSGYLIYATEVNWKPTITSCKSIAITFPD